MPFKNTTWQCQKERHVSIKPDAKILLLFSADDFKTVNDPGLDLGTADAMIDALPDLWQQFDGASNLDSVNLLALVEFIRRGLYEGVKNETSRPIRIWRKRVGSLCRVIDYEPAKAGLIVLLTHGKGGTQ